MVRKKKIKLKFRLLLFLENTISLLFGIFGLNMLVNFSWLNCLIYFLSWIIFLFTKDLTFDYYFEHKQNLRDRNAFKCFRRKLKRRGVDFYVEKNENGEKEIKI